MARDLGDGYELDDDPARVDRDAVHAYLATAYWAAGRSRADQDALIDGSARVVGLYCDGMQIGFARASEFDAGRFVYLADVYVLDGHQGRGLGLELVREMIENGPYAERRWLLHTRDAHGLYERFGFEPNERLLERGRPAHQLADDAARTGGLVIVICGPIASGKSTIARAVARELERRGNAAAAIDLDLVYEMLDPARGPKDDAAIWSAARRAAARLAGALLDDGRAVIAEGDYLHASERAEFLAALGPGRRVRFVTLSVAPETALGRTHEDPSRGSSRDPDFLLRHYEELAAALRSRPEGDLCLDTGAVGVDEAAAAVTDWATGQAAV